MLLIELSAFYGQMSSHMITNNIWKFITIVISSWAEDVVLRKCHLKNIWSDNHHHRKMTLGHEIVHFALCIFHTYLMSIWDNHVLTSYQVKMKLITKLSSPLLCNDTIEWKFCFFNNSYGQSIVIQTYFMQYQIYKRYWINLRLRFI